MGRRVCMVVRNQLWNDARVKKEARSLSDAGLRVIVIAKPEEGRPEREEVEGILALRPPKDSRFRRRLRERAISLQEEDRTASLLKRLISGLRRSKIRRALVSPVRQFRYWLRLLYAALCVRADVYHANDLDTLLICWISSRIRRARLVYDSHELWLESNRYLYETPLAGRLWYRLLEPLLLPAVDLVIAVTDGRSRHMLDSYPRQIRAPLIVVQNCPPILDRMPEPILLREKLGLPDDSIIALYQGILSENRGLEQLIAAAPIVLSRNRSVFFVVIGHDALAGRLQKLAVDAELDDRVLFMDPVPSEDLPAITAASDMGLILFQNSGLNNYYSLPNKLYEYMMAGIPLIASNFPEMSSIFKREECGLPVDPSSPADIARAVLELAGDPERRRTMGMLGREAALARHNWAIQERKLLAAYEGVLH